MSASRFRGESVDVPVEHVARRSGFIVGRWGIAPCPKCSAAQRGRKDKRPPVCLRKGGMAWWCLVCGEGGYAQAFGDVVPGDALLPKPAPVTYPPTWDIERLWESAREPAHESLKARGIDVDGLAFLDLARGAPAWRPDWWPWTSWVTVPLWDHRGQMRSLHGRRVDNGERVKQGCLPRGFACEALLMADGLAVEAMAGGIRAAMGVVCEGVTDYLRMATEVRQKHADAGIAVWGGIAGSFRALKPEWAEAWVICTDPDAAGDAYAKQALRAVGGALRYRGAVDVCETLKLTSLPEMVKASTWMTDTGA